jgi:hypothetical protein
MQTGILLEAVPKVQVFQSSEVCEGIRMLDLPWVWM